MNGWAGIAIGWMVTVMVVAVLLLLRHIDKLSRLLLLEVDIATCWAEIMGQFSAMRIDFGDEAAIEWLDAESHQAMDDLERMMQKAERLIVGSKPATPDQRQ